MDYLILGSNGIDGWPPQKAAAFVEKHIKVAVGTFDSWMIDYAMFAFTKDPIEHGQWSAEKLLAILNGQSVRKIPIAHNKKGRLMLNIKLANKLGIKVPYPLVLESVKTIH